MSATAVSNAIAWHETSDGDESLDSKLLDLLMQLLQSLHWPVWHFQRCLHEVNDCMWHNDTVSGIAAAFLIHVSIGKKALVC